MATTAYQRDSSSKRPRSSVAFAVHSARVNVGRSGLDNRSFHISLVGRAMTVTEDADALFFRAVARDRDSTTQVRLRCQSLQYAMLRYRLITC